MRRTPAFSLLRTSAALLVLSILTIATAITASTAPIFEPEMGEFITVYADDCVTPKTVFDPGEVVCVQAGNFPVASDWGYRYRRFSWVAPTREIMDQTNIKADPQYDRFVIPSSGSTGTWNVTTLDVDAGRRATAKFVVRYPFRVTTDLSIYKDGPGTVYGGQTVEFALTVSNPGPDRADGIEFTTEVPSNMVFLALKQASGPFFECRTPVRGGTGTIYCSTKSMALDESARLYAYYQVNPDARIGTICSASTQVMSYTDELRKEDNYTVTETEIGIENPEELPEPPPEDGE